MSSSSSSTPKFLSFRVAAAVPTLLLLSLAAAGVSAQGAEADVEPTACNAELLDTYVKHMGICLAQSDQDFSSICLPCLLGAASSSSSIGSSNGDSVGGDGADATTEDSSANFDCDAHRDDVCDRVNLCSSECRVNNVGDCSIQYEALALCVAQIEARKMECPNIASCSEGDANSSSSSTIGVTAAATTAATLSALGVVMAMLTI